MKIGIDARLYGTKHGGIGRYTQELIENLQKIDKENEYVIFCRKENFENIKVVKTWKKVLADIKHYSLKEQTILPRIFNKENLDLLHIPHFNVPLFYKKPFIVTIHDITWHKIKGIAATTLPAPLYWIKHFGYQVVLKNAIKNSKKIIAPSNFIKSELVKYFKIQDSKIIVAYEGVSRLTVTKTKSYVLIPNPYLLYVGNLYPHKNVESVVLALKILDSKFQIPNSRFSFVVVCSRDIFWKRLKRFVEKEKAQNFVKFIGYVSDEELAALYKNAEAFIFPSLFEGFGLPGLEAMACGTPVLASDIPVFREIYSDAAIYFNPKDVDDIVDKINNVIHLNALKRRSIINKGQKRAKMFSWQKMAEETLAVYENSIGL